MKTNLRWMGSACRSALVLTVSWLSLGSATQADVRFSINMNYDTTGTGQFNQFFNEFDSAFNEIESMLHSWSGPRAIESQYNGFTLDVEFAGLDGAGGIIAQAGPTDILTWGGPGYAKNGSRGAVARAGTMTVDTDDILFFAGTGQLRDIIIHEAFHALGFAPLWDDFGYRDASGLGYTGPNALAEYRRATGQPFAAFVPLERTGGAGTLGGHWDGTDPFFSDPLSDRQEIMVGFIAAPGVEAFISSVTLAQFRDLGYNVPSLEGGRPGGIFPGAPGYPGTKPNPPTDGEDEDDDTGIVDGLPGLPGIPGRPGRPGRPGDWTGDPGFPGGKGNDGWVNRGNRAWASGQFTGVPEPGSALILLSAGSLLLAGYRRRS